MTKQFSCPHWPKDEPRALLSYYTRRTQFESLARTSKFRTAAISLTDFPEFHGGASAWAIRRTDNLVRQTVSTHPNGQPIVSTDATVHPTRQAFDYSCCDLANFETLSAADGRAFWQR